MMKLDTTTLAAVVNRCFALSADGRFSDQQQSSFLRHGKTLRGHLLHLLSTQFNDGTQVVTNANSKLAEVNTQLQNDRDLVNNATETLTNVSDLVNILDKLFSIAVKLA